MVVSPRLNTRNSGHWNPNGHLLALTITIHLQWQAPNFPSCFVSIWCVSLLPMGLGQFYQTPDKVSLTYSHHDDTCLICHVMSRSFRDVWMRKKVCGCSGNDDDDKCSADEAYFNLDKFINSVLTHTNHNKIHWNNLVPRAYCFHLKIVINLHKSL